MSKDNAPHEAAAQPLSVAAQPLPPKRSLPPFAALRAFDAVARLGGVRKAALTLELDHAVVSRHLRAVESWTGMTLLERGRNGALLNQDGQRYHQQIATAMDLISGATMDLIRRGENNHLHIWCMPGFALHWLSARIAGFEKKHPGIAIEVQPTDHSPDFSSHDTDVNIRFVATYGPPVPLPANLRSQVVARVPVLAVASPGYLADAAQIRTPADLLQHKLLHEDSYDRWSNWLSGYTPVDELVLTGPRLWRGDMTMDAARHGRGIALANQLIADDDLKAGRLVQIGRDLPSFQPAQIGVYLLLARADRWEAPLIRRFRQWLVATLPAGFAPPEAG